MEKNEPVTVKIMCHNYLPAGTMLVSPDLYKLLVEKYSIDALDKLFLEKLGIRVSSSLEE